MPKVKNRTEALSLERAEAWAEYLETTRERGAHYGYEELEMWAWARLRNRLRKIDQREQRLKL